MRGEDAVPDQISNRDPWTIVAVVSGIVINLVVGGVLWGRADQKQTNTDARLDRTEMHVDAQAVQIATQVTQTAVTASQLGQIQKDVGEIKSTVNKLEQRR